MPVERNGPFGRLQALTEENSRRLDRHDQILDRQENTNDELRKATTTLLVKFALVGGLLMIVFQSAVALILMRLK